MRFELARQSIAGWSADTAGFVAAASRASSTSHSEREIAEQAFRTLWAVREEMSALSDASRAAGVSDPDLLRGIETALAELGSLDREIAGAIDRMSVAER